MRLFLPSITTHGIPSSTWIDKIQEVMPLGLRHIALFLTGLSPEHRLDCYRRLETVKKNHYFSIPFVHAVSSMPDWEFRYLMESFDTQAFNLHPTRSYPLEFLLSTYVKKRIFIENGGVNSTFTADDLVGFAGVCYDLSHLEDSRRFQSTEYEHRVSFAESTTCGANHISAVSDKVLTDKQGNAHSSVHTATDPSQFDYLAFLDPRCFSQLCAIELENPLAQQVAFIKPIEAAMNHAESAAQIKRAA